MRQTITIIGGGITGLTIAHRLVCLADKENLPIDITLIESSNRLGGVIKSEALEDFVIEHGPDAFLVDKPEIKNLLSELGLIEEILATNENNRKAYIARNNTLMPLPAGFFMIAPTKCLPFIKSSLFSLLGKLRIVLEVFVPKKMATSDESVANFLSRRFGNELMECAGQALVGGIYMADINILSAQATLAQFVDLESQFGSVIKGLIKSAHYNASTASGARYNLFGTLKNGMQVLIDRLVEKITGVKIDLNTSMLALSKGKIKNWQVKTTNGQFETDAIVFAIPAQYAAQGVEELDPALAKSLVKIESSNSVVVNLLYHKSDIGKAHKGFGFVIPTTEQKKIIAAGFISQKFHYRGKANYEMIRVFLGGQLAPDLFQLSDMQLIELAQKELSQYLKIKAPAIKTWLSRFSCALPFYQVGHKDVVEDIKILTKKYPGLFFSGSSYNGLGIPDCVREGEKTATLLVEYIKQGKLACLSPTV